MAHDLSKRALASPRPGHGLWLGFVEAAVLAVVAVATAWSGYEASRWDALSATSYALYERYTVLSQEKSTLAGQDRLYDIVTFNGWVASKIAGRDKLSAFYERRFRPEYAVAFRAWLHLDPFHNASAPAGPIFMPQYNSRNGAAAVKYDGEAAKAFDLALASRDGGDNYLRVTVFLATVLFLTALAQRFEYLGPRIVLVGIAAVLLSGSVFWLLTLART